jgi:undecaprenyl diphosphate synthase
MGTALNHVAIVMDGNGRWASQRGFDRLSGHRAGAKVLPEVVRRAAELEISHLTLYAFSFENWRRPQLEVFGLMALLEDYLKKEPAELKRNGVRLNAIGALDMLPLGVRDRLKAAIDLTKSCSRLTLTLALSYGSRNEIARAARRIAQDVKAGHLDDAQIDEHVFGRYLDTFELPDVDLFIRTSGEMRMSNFLLWQSSYAELYLTKTLWPDFRAEELDQAVQFFYSRERRFGHTSEQVAAIDGEVRP